MIARLLFSVICALGVGICALADDDMGSKTQTAKVFKGKTTREYELKYLLHLPEGHDAKGEKRWPLLLFLHGAGERGTNLSRVAVHGPPKLVKSNPNFPFVLVSPQCPSGEVWSDEALLALLDEVIAAHRIDESRVYLSGLSMGGYGTWSLGLKHPTRFAAIAPICGGGDILTILLARPGNSGALRKLPVWAFHGARDGVVPLAESERMVNALKRHGNANVKLTVYPDADHDSWTQTYNNQELFDWFLAQKR